MISNDLMNLMIIYAIVVLSILALGFGLTLFVKWKNNKTNNLNKNNAKGGKENDKQT